MRDGEQHRAALALAPTRSPSASAAHTRLLRSLVRLAGRDGSEFEAKVLDDGSVSIRGPATTAFYAAEAWTTKVLRHLHQGFYDARAPHLWQPPQH